MAKRQPELEKMSQDISQEIDGDAEVLAKELFGDKMPDMLTASDSEALAIMRQKFLENDRQFLLGEAKRDPEQFLRITRQLGVIGPDGVPATANSDLSQAVMTSPPAAAPTSPPAPAQPPY